MTTPVCNTLAEHEGVVNAYSWPTGMRNDGPTEYGIYFDPERIDADDLTDALRDAERHHNGPGVYLETRAVDTDEPDRVNEALDERNTAYPMLTARVVRNPVAEELGEYLADEPDIVWWDIQWDVPDVIDSIETAQFIASEPPHALTVFIESDDDTRYDDIVDVVSNITDTHASTSDPSVEVTQGDSDGYQLHISLP